jgi:phosphoribosylformimino-5-aminoimidazole carboxamide ribotide isomerase
MIQIIPAIDLIEGKCVRLTKGDYATQKIYNEDPLEVAKSFEDIGITRLHLVDLDGAKQKKVVNLRVLENIATKTRLVIDFGGGIQSDSDVKSVFDAGAQMITCGSIAIKNRPLFEKWVLQYDADRIILAADVKDNKVAIHGWLETSETTVFDFIESYQSIGITRVLCTDISKDGMLGGTAIDLYRSIQERFEGIKLIASGGVSSIDDLHALNEAGIYSVVFGKAIYEGRIKLDELKVFYT